ncbi:MAG TPA: DUF2974 domain-containing protein [Candidatus Onthousia excrementipullorum]|uniref:DUF2974 domain-containing protein n=1 Tax=Candidatus Onthousia excrementipullorum TaxID=2840884 RepID=A0A9D1DU69_9FIRM|nr:DUF2974 domain-containing protein [Candidatus Onthousia excrementipullorum]
MKNFLDYLQDNNKTFKESSFNSIDSLILAYLSYFHFPNTLTRLKDLDISKTTKVEKNREFIKRVVTSNRYKDIESCFYVEDTNDLIEKQFSAVTFLLPNNTMYISFRGTDSTLTGWKEDFNMAFMLPVPAQKEALNYVEKVTKLIPRKFYIGGHSKGGNLAVYAGCNLSNNLSTRIIKIYSHDGPGFIKEFLTTSNYQNIKDKIEKIVPSSSIIGMLLYTNENYKIIESSARGILEHDPFSWLINENNFIILKKLSDGTVFTNKVINDFLSSLSKKEREIFIDSLFTVLKSTNLTTLDEISKNFIVKLPNILIAIYKLDDVNKKYIIKTIKALIKSCLTNLSLLIHGD